VSDDISIRVATPEDADGISALLTTLAEEFIVGDFSTKGREHLMTEFSSGALAGRLALVEYRFHVAEVREELAGVVAMRGNSHLYLLFVGKSWHRRGLARRLWRVARQAAPAEVERFTVNASRFAVPAYERLGFRSVGPALERSGVRAQPMEWLVSAAGRPS
jgi:GNAT superfamily N-acetyltransferase